MAGAGETLLLADQDERALRHPAVVTLALGARGLSRLGLPSSAVESFPFAFNMGMVDPARARMLGDTGENAAEHWRWGRTQPDVILLMSGAKDPVGNSGKGVKQVYGWLKKTGHSPELKLYEGGRHEMLNEANRDEVYRDVLSWLERRLPA